MDRSRGIWVVPGCGLVAFVAGLATIGCGGGTGTTEAVPPGGGPPPPSFAGVRMTDGQVAQALDTVMIGTISKAGVIIFWAGRSDTPPYMAPTHDPPPDPAVLALATRVTADQQVVERNLVATMTQGRLDRAETPQSDQLDREAVDDLAALHAVHGAARDRIFVDATVQGLLETRDIVEAASATVRDPALREVVTQSGALVSDELPAAYDAMGRAAGEGGGPPQPLPPSVSPPPIQ
jgi:Domain of unknown function (DUF4142)